MIAYEEFADYGVTVKYMGAKPCSEAKNHMCGVWGRILSTPMSNDSWAREVLLKGVPRAEQATRQDVPLCALRFAVLSRGWRGWPCGYVVLFKGLLHGASPSEHEARHLPERRSCSSSSSRCGSDSRPSFRARRGRSPHRRRQAQLPSVEPRRFPGSGYACTVSLWGHDA